MDAGFTAVRLGRALAVVCAVLALGTVGFHAAHDEGWLQSLYRAVLAGSLSGVELVPGNDPAQAVSVFMVLSGLTILRTSRRCWSRASRVASSRAHSSNGGDDA